jgi:cell division protein ZapA (FtsZ GTPase activity inhibitor)
LRSINVWLGGRSYRIRVKPEEEGTVRAAVKLADEKITEMRQHYAGRDDQDFMAMVLLLCATQAATSSGAANPVIEAQVNQMIEKLDAALTEGDDTTAG